MSTLDDFEIAKARFLPGSLVELTETKEYAEFDAFSFDFQEDDVEVRVVRVLRFVKSYFGAPDMLVARVLVCASNKWAMYRTAFVRTEHLRVVPFGEEALRRLPNKGTCTVCRAFVRQGDGVTDQNGNRTHAACLLKQEESA